MYHIHFVIYLTRNSHYYIFFPTEQFVLNKPLFHFPADTTRVRIIPHYKHFLKDPLWPSFLTHSTVPLTDSWPHARHKSRAHSLVFQAARFASGGRRHFLTSLAAVRLRPTVTWALFSWRLVFSKIRTCTRLSSGLSLPSWQEAKCLPFERLPGWVSLSCCFLTGSGNSLQPQPCDSTEWKCFRWVSSQVSCILKFRPGEVSGDLLYGKECRMAHEVPGAPGQSFLSDWGKLFSFQLMHTLTGKPAPA